MTVPVLVPRLSTASAWTVGLLLCMACIFIGLVLSLTCVVVAAFRCGICAAVLSFVVRIIILILVFTFVFILGGPLSFLAFLMICLYKLKNIIDVIQVFWVFIPLCERLLLICIFLCPFLDLVAV